MLRLIDHLKDRLTGKAPKGAKRDPGWRALRNRYIKKFPECAVCNRKAKQVHHKIPFHYAPDLEKEWSNLMSMCRRCHLLIGHCANYQNFNTTIDADAKYWSMKIKGK